MKLPYAAFFGPVLLAMLIVTPGCGGSGGKPTKPEDLKPLTEEQKAAIKKQDAQVDDEESNSIKGFEVKKKK